jgi:hypothetical protein
MSRSTTDLFAKCLTYDEAKRAQEKLEALELKRRAVLDELREIDRCYDLVPPSEVSATYRAQLGRRGFRYALDGDFARAQNSLGYVPRERAPVVSPDYAANDPTHEAFIAASQRAADEMSGARAALVARLEAEHVRASESAGLLHPRPHWSGRNAGRRKR